MRFPAIFSHVSGVENKKTYFGGKWKNGFQCQAKSTAVAHTHFAGRQKKANLKRHELGL